MDGQELAGWFLEFLTNLVWNFQQRDLGDRQMQFERNCLTNDFVKLCVLRILCFGRSAWCSPSLGKDVACQERRNGSHNTGTQAKLQHANKRKTSVNLEDCHHIAWLVGLCIFLKKMRSAAFWLEKLLIQFDVSFAAKAKRTLKFCWNKEQCLF